jgi:fibro-slime domain-containing protein
MQTDSTFTIQQTVYVCNGVPGVGADAGVGAAGAGGSSVPDAGAGAAGAAGGAGGVAPAVCGDGIVEGSESCDDGNLIPYDGCSPTCTLEPKCTAGTCAVICGDGIVEAPEACDDGNTLNGDGCSSTCTVEPGWVCTSTNPPPGPELVIPILYRDMLYANTTVPGPGHPDFESFACGATSGLVNSALGPDNEPTFGPNGISCLTNPVDLCWWYHETGCNGAGSTNPFDKLVYLDKLGKPTTLTLAQTSANFYQFSSTLFFPIDGLGWNTGLNSQVGNDCSGGTGHNFSFTSELHYPFTYSASSSPTLSFTGDDDAWVFINKRLAVDLGGIHGPASGTVTLTAAQAANYGLIDGATYSIDFFQAERHTCGSDFTLTLGGFEHAVSTCLAPNTSAAACANGTCSYTCDPGYSDCNAAVAPNTDGCECATATTSNQGTIGGCCGTGCQTMHSNGIGQAFFDCAPPGTYTGTEALAACLAATGDASKCETFQCVGSGSQQDGDGVVCDNQGNFPCNCWDFSAPLGPPHLPPQNPGHVNRSCRCATALDPLWH